MLQPQSLPLTVRRLGVPISVVVHDVSLREIFLDQFDNIWPTNVLMDGQRVNGEDP